MQALQAADFPRLRDAIHSYAQSIGRSVPGEVAVAIANPITGDQVYVTHADWSFSQEEVKAEFGLHTLRLLNNFTALAVALPDLPACGLRHVGGIAPVPRAPMALVGSDTGPGVPRLIPVGEASWVPLPGKGDM
jgi:glucokinase